MLLSSANAWLLFDGIAVSQQVLEPPLKIKTKVRSLLRLVCVPYPVSMKLLLFYIDTDDKQWHLPSSLSVLRLHDLIALWFTYVIIDARTFHNHNYVERVVLHTLGIVASPLLAC